MKINPLHDYVLVKRAEEDTKTRGGLFIPSTATKQSIHGEVLAIGTGKILDNGVRVEPLLKPGDRILLNEYGGQEIEIDGDKLLLIKEDQILGIFR